MAICSACSPVCAPDCFFLLSTYISACPPACRLSLQVASCTCRLARCTKGSGSEGHQSAGSTKTCPRYYSENEDPLRRHRMNGVRQAGLSMPDDFQQRSNTSIHHQRQRRTQQIQFKSRRRCSYSVQRSATLSLSLSLHPDDSDSSARTQNKITLDLVQQQNFTKCRSWWTAPCRTGASRSRR